MIRPIDCFTLNIQQVTKLNDLHMFLKEQFTDAIDIDGLLRSQIVFAVSALDHYIHEAVVYEAKRIIKDNKPHPASFGKLLMGLDEIHMIVNGTLDIIPIIEQSIRKRLGWRSFQKADNINEALKMVFIVDFWNGLESSMGIVKSDIKQRLDIIAKKRDIIAHESDYDPVNNEQYPITVYETRETVNFIISFVTILDSILF